MIKVFHCPSKASRQRMESKISICISVFNFYSISSLYPVRLSLYFPSYLLLSLFSSRFFMACSQEDDFFLSSSRAFIQGFNRTMYLILYELLTFFEKQPQYMYSMSMSCAYSAAQMSRYSSARTLLVLTASRVISLTNWQISLQISLMLKSDVRNMSIAYACEAQQQPQLWKIFLRAMMSLILLMRQKPKWMWLVFSGDISANCQATIFRRKIRQGNSTLIMRQCLMSVVSIMFESLSLSPLSWLAIIEPIISMFSSQTCLTRRSWRRMRSLSRRITSQVLFRTLLMALKRNSI